MPRREYHVESVSDGRWRVRRGDQDAAESFYLNQDAAISAARVLAQRSSGHVFIHQGAGRILRTDHRGTKKDTPRWA